VAGLLPPEAGKPQIGPARTLPCLGVRALPGGVIGAMKGMPDGDEWAVEAFARRDYVSVQTHICFNSPRALRWLADALVMWVSLPRRDVAVLLPR